MAEKRGSNGENRFSDLQRDSQKIMAALLTGDRDRDHQTVSLLLATINAASGSADPSVGARRLVDMILKLTGAERGLLISPDEHGKLRVVLARDQDGVDMDRAAPFSTSVTSEVLRSGRSICIIDTLRGDNQQTDSMAAMALRTIMCAPLEVHGEILGVMYVDSRVAREGFDDSDLTLFEALSQQLATTLDNLQLLRSKTRAEDVSEAMGGFLARFSGEIQQPLRSLLGITSLLALETLSEEQRQLTSLAQSHARELLGVAEDINDMWKLQTGAAAIAEEPIELHEVLDDLKRTLTPEASAKGLDIVSIFETDPPHRLNGDARRIAQLLRLLGENAVRFTDVGEVSISVDCVEQDDEMATIRFEVGDTGIGIPEDQLELIFEPFTRAHSPSEERAEGRGMGLALAKRIAEALGGRLGVDSVEKHGSIFWAELPLAK